VPSPWLSLVAQLVRPEGVELPFVAPELAEVNRTTSPVQSDLYGLGCLTWFLLTGERRARAEARLPSEARPELTGWDAFIDGCCRSHPERRFHSIGAALAALPPTDAHAARRPQANRSSAPIQPSRTPWSRHRWKCILAGLVVLVLIGVILRRDQI